MISTKYLKIALLYSTLFWSCSKYSEDLPKQCVLPYIDFVTYNINPSTLQVGFTGITAINGTITSYKWDFGDGTTSNTAVPPIHTYPQLSSTQPTKTYNVKFTATNSCGSSYWTKSINVGPCLANVKFTYTRVNDSTIRITNSTTSSSSVNYSWNFGDGTISTQSSSTFTYSYKTSGTYRILLKATNTCGENQFFLDVTITKLATITTNTATNITSSSALCGGNISNTGATVTSRGIVWSTNPSPDISLPTKLTSGSGLGQYNITMTNLSPNTQYYVRAFAIISTALNYGNEVTFKTLGSLPTVQTNSSINSITQTSAISGGSVTNDGGLTVTERGLCISTNTNPDIYNSTLIISGSGLGVFTTNITGLTPSTLYYVRAYAKNALGPKYGNIITFTTLNYNIGSTGPAGGLIFHDNGSYAQGWRYLEAAPSDQSSSARWGCSGVNVSGAVATTLGSGFTNTTSIVTSCTTTGIAAKLCDQLVLNGFSDWYLPSYSELNKVYTN
jgi:hypothetical protein